MFWVTVGSVSPPSARALVAVVSKPNISEELWLSS